MLRSIQCPYALAPVLLLAIALGTGGAQTALNRLEMVVAQQSGHDRLLGRHFHHDFVPHGRTESSVTVPAGSRLRSFDNVSLRHGYIDTSDGDQRFLVWNSDRHRVKFIPEDGNWMMRRWKTVDRALTGYASDGG